MRLLRYLPFYGYYVIGKEISSMYHPPLRHKIIGLCENVGLYFIVGFVLAWIGTRWWLIAIGVLGGTIIGIPFEAWLMYRFRWKKVQWQYWPCTNYKDSLILLSQVVVTPWCMFLIGAALVWVLTGFSTI